MPTTATRRVVMWACRVLGLVLFALWLVPYLAVQLSPERGDTLGAVTPVGDFALTRATKVGSTCTITPNEGESRTVTLSTEASFWTWGAAMGPVVHAWYDGSALMSCGPGEVYVTSGRPLALEPLAHGWPAPGAALLLVGLGWVPLWNRRRAGRTA